MTRHQVVGAVGYRGHDGDMRVQRQRNARSCEREQTKHCLGACRNATVGLDEVNRARETVELESREPFGEARGVGRHVFDTVIGPVTPARDPEPAESAVAVEDHERAVRRHSDILFDSRLEAP
jgi:hypothetical protein